MLFWRWRKSSRPIKEKGESMERVLPQLRRWLAVISNFFGRFQVMLRPQNREGPLQRMCPFCGLITPRSKRSCLECGKPLRAIQLERKDARQG
jgi:hypothetical protein